MKQLLTHSSEETEKEAIQFSKQLTPNTVIALTGGLGAGKTTFTKGVAIGLGIKEAVTSPTFTLIQEYEGRLPMVHMDLYRLESLEEFELLGAEDYFYNGGVTLIEWSEKATEILPEETIFIHIEVQEGNQRKISIRGPGF